MVASIASFLDVCRFNPTAGGTTDWTVSSGVNGYQTPVLAGAVNTATYRYRAESADLTQWEIGYGVYTVSTTILTRATVLYNSAGTGTGAGQSGAGTKINFSTVPQVAVVALTEDFLALTTGQIPGTITNDNASTGNVGEYVVATLVSGSATALTSGTPKTIISISLTAGDWDVDGVAGFSPAGGAVLSFGQESISLTNNALNASFPNYASTQWIGPFSSGPIATTGRVRVSISTTTTVFLVANVSYTPGTCGGYGYIQARRVR
jgi:hypothetical protein